MKFLKQLFLVLLKNLQLQIRRPCLIVELLCPIISVVTIVVIRFTVNDFRPSEECFVTFESDHLIQPFTGNFTIFYTPNDSDTRLIASIVQSHLIGGTLLPVNSQQDMINQIRNTTEGRIRGCFLNGTGIVFDLTRPSISYTLRLRHETPTIVRDQNRWHTRITSPSTNPSGPRVYDNAYFNEGFLHLEHLTSLAIIQWITGKWPHEISSVAMKQLPHKHYIRDQFLKNVNFILPFVLMAAFLLPVGLFTKDLVREKESRMRETMKIMGLNNWALWMAWVLKQILLFLLPTIIFAIILKYGQIFIYSHPGALIILMLCYLLTMISFSFLVSVWFNSSKLGMMVAFVFWFLTYIPHIFLGYFYDSLSLWVKLLSCLFSNTCIGLAVNVVSILELREEGFQFSDFSTRLSADDEFNMHAVIGMMIFDAVLYFVAAWYLNEVKPGEYGIPKKFYFPFQPSYWTGKPFTMFSKATVCPTRPGQDDEEIILGTIESVASTNSSAHELPDPEPVIGVHVKGLTKKFKAHQYSGTTEVMAVNNVNLKLYKGQITALLGHNAAGKTTLISMLTGLYPPTSGSIFINGIDQLKNVNSLNANIGVCPQHNILFDDLTVREHLVFFARLKGVKNVSQSVEEILDDLNLKDHSKVRACKLSGGFKRKLSVGIALIGNPDVLVLDEPTSGMDYKSRKQTLELLERRKNMDCTILMTTHNMDNAEKADRIAIMADGRIECSDQPQFLKKRYGVGYNLTVELLSTDGVPHLERAVKDIIVDCEMVTLGKEVQFLLPYEKMPHFSELFTVLESKESSLSISSFSVQENRMEDVFIKMREGKSFSWEARVKQMSQILSMTSSNDYHHPVLPLSSSLNSVDLNNAFEGVDQLNMNNLGRIDEESSQHDGYPVTESSFGNRTFSGSFGHQAAGLVSSHMNPLHRVSVPSKRNLASPRRHTTPSILQAIDPYFNRDTEDSESAESIKNEPGARRDQAVSEELKRRLKQYKAMLIKRFFNYIRFRVGFVWQFLLPILFVLLGLVLAVTIPAIHHDDEIRKLTLPESAPTEANEIFWADFTPEGFPFNIEDLSSGVFGSPEVHNVTQKVKDILYNVRPTNSTRDCCNYKFQLLDRYCATRTMDELQTECSSDQNFGYHKCLDRCFNCCESKRHQLPSCSNPRYQQISSILGIPDASNFCPTPPKLSTTVNDSDVGPLSAIELFIAEYLLERNKKENAFFNIIMGGFTIAEPQPAYSTCNRTGQPLKIVDAVNALISEQCYGRIPILPLYSKDDVEFQTPFTGQSSSLVAQSQFLQNETEICNTSRFILSSLQGCKVPGYCVDATCFDCECKNEALNSWYGDFEPGTAASILIWYNNQHYHISPAMLSLLHNLYLKKYADNYSITVHNHPLPRNPESKAATVQADVIIFCIGLLASFGFSFLVASYALFIVHEKSSKVKHLQVVSGLRITPYWLANFTWDLISSLVPIILSVVLFIIVSQIGLPHFEKPITLFAVFCLFFLLCWAEIPLIYVLSLPFENVYSAYTLLFIMTSMTTLIFLSVLYLINVVLDGYRTTAEVLHYIFLLNPSYGLASGLSDMYVSHVLSETCRESSLSILACKQANITYYQHPFELERPGIGTTLIYLAVEGVVFMLLTLIIDNKNYFVQLFGRRKNWELSDLQQHAKASNNKLKKTTMDARPKSSYGLQRIQSELPQNAVHLSRGMSTTGCSELSSKPKRPYSRAMEDKSVRCERKTVEYMLQSNAIEPDCSIVLSEVSKQYDAGIWTKFKKAWTMKEERFPAVSEMNLIIRKKECFGLAGFNGAGKTTIFKILTGDIHCTNGVAVVCGYNISTHIREVQRYLGYCPQFDALVERMTGRENLTMFARIKGLPEDTIQEEVKNKLNLLNLNKHADIQCWKYSGGNRRKLSAAIALIGDPKVILLDEPTTGMDIETRDQFIRLLQKILKDKDTSVVLTSHSISECEAVCNRIGILIQGKFRCIGSTEDLKDKYGEQETKVVIRVENNERHSSIQDIPRKSSAEATHTVYNRVQSVRRFLSTQLITTPLLDNLSEEEDIDGESNEEESVDNGTITQGDTHVSDEEEGGCDNKYLVEVRKRFQSHFRRVRGVKMISCKRDEVTFKLPKGVPLSKIFDVMENMKEDSHLHVINYTVSQSNLEQVYNFFADER